MFDAKRLTLNLYLHPFLQGWCFNSSSRGCTFWAVKLFEELKTYFLLTTFCVLPIIFCFFFPWNNVDTLDFDFICSHSYQVQNGLAIIIHIHVMRLPNHVRIYDFQNQRLVVETCKPLVGFRMSNQLCKGSFFNRLLSWRSEMNFKYSSIGWQYELWDWEYENKITT